MRTLYVIMVASIPFISGCTALLVAGGQDLSKLKTRSEVLETFGDPVASEQVDTRFHDDFRIRRKIAKDHGWAQGYGMVTALSWGFSEFILFPFELTQTVSRLLFGKEIRFDYDENGEVTAVTIDGYTKNRHPTTPPDPMTIMTTETKEHLQNMR